MPIAVVRRAAAAAATAPRAASSSLLSRFISCNAASSIDAAPARIAGLTASPTSDGARIPRSAASSSTDGALDAARIARLTASPTSDGARIPRPAASSSIHGATFPGLARASSIDAAPALIARLTASPTSDGARLTRAAPSSSGYGPLTRATASFPAAAGLLTTRFGVPTRGMTGGTAPTLVRCIHILPLRPIDPGVLLAVKRLNYGEYQRYKETADNINQLRAAFIQDETDTLLFITGLVVHIGSISWRVCTTVLAVAVGAGFGLLQVAKSGWEEQFNESADCLITSNIANAKAEIKEHLLMSISHRRSVSAAYAFLEGEKMKERTMKLEEREALVAAKEEDALAWEVAKEALPEKEGVSAWRSVWRR